LIEAIELNPFAGIGKPEPLKHNLAGSWSRRINREHRLVYEISSENEIIILEIQSLRGHY
jgi:toxin YoeB